MKQTQLCFVSLEKYVKICTYFSKIKIRIIRILEHWWRLWLIVYRNELKVSLCA